MALGTKRILIIGKNGQLGWELQKTLRPLGELVALSREQLNLAALDRVRNEIRNCRPDIIINAAAYTAVEQAEDDTQEAQLINATAPAVLAQEAKNIGALFIHYSTDYVFDGAKGMPYCEADSPAPLNVYGRTKLEGEIAIRATGGWYLIFRTSWVYALRGKNFVLTMLRLIQQGDEIKVVDDQIGVPNWSRPIAEATAHIAGQALARMETATFDQIKGIYHLSGPGPTSWFHFAREIVRVANTSGDGNIGQVRQQARLVNIPTEKYPSRIKRPRYSVLDSHKLHDVFGIMLPHWQEQLRRAFSEPV